MNSFTASKPSVELILFLDLDNMLQPNIVLTERANKSLAVGYDGPRGIYAPILGRILSPYLNRIEIVISSWSACHQSLAMVKARLPDDIATRVTDKIYLDGLEADYRSDLVTRYECIRLWLARRRPDYAGPWLALDRDYFCWPRDALDHLILAGGTLGDQKTQERLSARLGQALAPQLE